MTQNLFRITVDEPNYSRLLGSTPDETRLEDAFLSNLTGTRLWAQKDTTKGQQIYDAMEPGDGLVFYKVKRGMADDEQHYVGAGTVGEQYRLDGEQATTLFNTSVATLAYTVTDFEKLRMTTDEMSTVLGYDSYPQSSHRVTDDRYATVDDVLATLAD